MDLDLLHLAFDYGLLKESEAAYTPSPDDELVGELLKKYPNLAHAPKPPKEHKPITPAEHKHAALLGYHDRLNQLRHG
jgi:hypothetical protein